MFEFHIVLNFGDLRHFFSRLLVRFHSKKVVCGYAGESGWHDWTGFNWHFGKQ